MMQLMVIAPKERRKPPIHPKKAPHNVLARLLGTGRKMSKASAEKSVVARRPRVVVSASAME
jgi:hypothetical protein